MPFQPRSSRLIRAAAPWGWAVSGGVLGLGLALVFFAPAAWLAEALLAGTQGQVQVIETRGTVWTGSGRLLLAGGSGSRDSAALPGRIEWTLRPAWRGLVRGISFWKWTGRKRPALPLIKSWNGCGVMKGLL